MLYDVATGAGNTGLQIFYTTAWVIGRDPVTGGHRAQCSFTSARGAAATMEAYITTNKGRLQTLVEPGEDPAPKPVFLPDERIQVLLRFDSPRPLRGLARVEWEQGGQRATVFRGLITSNTDAGFTLLPPFSEQQVDSIPAANLILRVTGAAHHPRLH